MKGGARAAAGAQFRPGCGSASSANLRRRTLRAGSDGVGATSPHRTWLGRLCGIAAWLSLIGNPGTAAATEARCELALEAEAGGVHHFQVELAQTPEEQARGLMHRESLEVGHGMLFVLPIARRTAMWMKDTRIPLDMVFFDSAGIVVHLEQHTEPHSVRMLGPEQPVRYVLELNAGEAGSLRHGGPWRLDIAALAACLSVRATTGEVPRDP